MSALRMTFALHMAAEDRTGVDAGRRLARAGLAVFPVPRGQKFDDGWDALCYADATTDPDEWDALANRATTRHGCPDVNPALSPWRSVVPLVVLDLDGPEAVERFDQDHELPASTFRVTTAGKGGGAHVYVSGADEPIRGTHRWGGEIRSDRGHVMAPGSAIQGNRHHYRPTGSVFAMASLLVGVGRVPTARSGGRPAVPIVEPLVDRLSIHPPDRQAMITFSRRVEQLGKAPVGERHPSMVSAVGAAVHLAYQGGLPLRWAISTVIDQWSEVCDRDADEVWAVVAWALGQELNHDHG